jgi:hypothetical protein
MLDDLIVQAMETFTLVGILVAAGIFLRLGLKARSIGSFRFQLSIFMLAWVAAEIPHVAETLGLVATGSYDDLGLGIHLTSMALFAVFVGLRSYKFLSLKPLPPLPPPGHPVLPTGA